MYTWKSALGLLVVGLILAAGFSLIQSSGVQLGAKEVKGDSGHAAMGDKMPEECGKMMPEERIAELEELVSKMNVAKEKDKLDAIVAVINELVAQRREAQGKCNTSEMKQHMKSDAGSGMMKGMMGDGMSSCSMMDKKDGKGGGC